ncbi:ketopantoate reductase family protein [Bacillus sp. UMB0893]|uniref:ketopantoate reductase family protein n=1 Tax=Bacillus sp. UMB0893 TaxID=2066053 RepID=UPI0026A233FF|nr:ketopantoate reductase family protein [Bacillus sp. UMB0893]
MKMKTLVVGAGAVGGYFGARLAEKGEDVAFLVREKRAAQLADNRLKVKSVHGDVDIDPKTRLATQKDETYDLILLSVKSYHLKNVIKEINPFVGDHTLILPLLNGYSHLDALQETFSKERVIGGLCFIETTLDQEGSIVQTSPIHELVYGAITESQADSVKKLEALFSGTKATIHKSDTIITDMWHKYMFIAGLSGVTTLFRSPIGPIRENEYGLAAIENLFFEIGRIMRAAGAPIADNVEEIQINKIHNMTAGMKSSMQRDMEKEFEVEADHLQGYLLEMAKLHSIDAPILSMVYANLKMYEVNR